MYWEYQYLDKHFPGRAFPMEHGLVADEPPDRAWDEHTFMWRGRKTVVWFDITKQFRAFSKAHPADRWSSPDKFYSFAPPQGWTHREDAPGSHRSFAWISPDGKAEIRISANYDLVRLPKELPDQIVDAFLGNERGITPMQKVRGTGWDGLRREYTNADQSTRWLVVSARSGTTLVGLTMSAPEAEFERFRPIFESVSNSLKLGE